MSLIQKKMKHIFEDCKLLIKPTINVWRRSNILKPGFHFGLNSLGQSGIGLAKIEF